MGKTIPVSGNRRATEEDYIRLQGGVPEIKQEGNLWLIIHRYREDAPVVKTHIPPEKRGVVIIDGVEYEVARLWQFEGGPCERRSRSVGGEGYERKEKE